MVEIFFVTTSLFMTLLKPLILYHKPDCYILILQIVVRSIYICRVPGPTIWVLGFGSWILGPIQQGT